MTTRASAIRAGRAFVEIFADSSQLVRGLKQARGQVVSFGKDITSIGVAFTGLGAAIATPLIFAAKRFGDTGDRLFELSQETRVSVEALSELGYVSEQTGGTLESLGRNIYLMGQFITRAATGAFGADKTLQRLGLTFKDIADLDTEQRFLLFAEALSRVADAADRSNLARNVFGRGARENLALFERGTVWIEEMRKQFRSRGLTISTADAEAANTFHDLLADIAAVANKVMFAIGAQLAPAFSDLVVRFQKLSRVVIEFIENNGDFIRAVALVSGAIVALGGTLLFVGGSIVFFGAVIGTLVSAVGALHGALSLILSGFIALTSPITIVIGSLAFLASKFVDFAAISNTVIDWLRGRFSLLMKRVNEVVGGIVAALQAGDIRLAAEVLWAGLAVVWAEGVVRLKEALLPLQNLWNGLWKDLAVFGLVAMTGFLTSLSQIWANMKSSFVDLITFIKTKWSELMEWRARQEANLGQALAVAEIDRREKAELKDLRDKRNPLNKKASKLSPTLREDFLVNEENKIRERANAAREQINRDAFAEQERITAEGLAEQAALAAEAASSRAANDAGVEAWKAALEDDLVLSIAEITERLAVQSQLAGAEVDDAREKLEAAKMRLAEALESVRGVPQNDSFGPDRAVLDLLSRIKGVGSLSSTNATSKGAFNLSSGSLLGLQSNAGDRVLQTLQTIAENTEETAINTAGDDGGLD